ncbi:unnamed protein product, partial [Effrenium voratum]
PLAANRDCHAALPRAGGRGFGHRSAGPLPRLQRFAGLLLETSERSGADH